MQKKHKQASFIEFMSLCFKEDETHNEVTIVRNPLLLNLNDSYILKTMGKIQLHSVESDNLKLLKVLRKENINSTSNSIICLINDYCLNKSYKTKLEFEYLSEQIQQSKAQLILFDISCELDHNELSILLKEQLDQMTTIIAIQNRNFREFMKFSSYYENTEDDNYIKKIENKKRAIFQLTGELSKFYQNSILIDSKSQYDFINIQLFDKIVLIPFQDGYFYQLIDPIKKELPVKCQLYLLEILMTYKCNLSKVLLLLPLSFPLPELFNILCLLLDYCNLSCGESFVHIQQIYSKQFKKIQLAITFGNNEQLIKQSFEDYLIKQIFENDYYLAFQQLEKQDQQFITNALSNIKNNIIINIIENTNNKIEQFLNELEKTSDNRQKLKRMKQILQKIQIQYSYQNSLKSLTGPNSQLDIYSNTSDEFAFDLSWDGQDIEQGNYVLVDQ